MTQVQIPVTHWGAREAWDRLLIEQPHVDVEGLYYAEKWFLILCPGEAALKARDGRSLALWFKNACKPAGSPVRIVSALPSGAVRLEPRSPVERATLAGSPRTVYQAYVDVALSLPHEFPDFSIHDEPGTLILTTARILSEDEQSAVSNAFSLLDLGLEVRTNVDPALHVRPEPVSDGMNVVISRCLRGTVSKGLQWLVVTARAR